MDCGQPVYWQKISRLCFSILIRIFCLNCFETFISCTLSNDFEFSSWSGEQPYMKIDF